MAVYTEVTQQDITAFLRDYGVGECVSLSGIAEGVENSNFLLRTSHAPFILTLYEKRVNREELPFFLELLAFLAKKSVPCPLPVAALNGEIVKELNHRPAAMVSFLPGKAVTHIRNHHCSEVGRHLAAMHLAAQEFRLTRKNNFALPKWHELFAAVKHRADELQPGLAEEIEKALAELAVSWPRHLPSGVIHADLFPDNVFFDKNPLPLGASAGGEEYLSGMIDFYFACNDFFMYDLAIVMNAWCFEQAKELNITKTAHLLAAYNKIRPISEEELQALPVLARGAAVRFLLTRLYDWFNPAEGALVTLKNPLEYLHKLRFHLGISHASAYGLEVNA